MQMLTQWDVLVKIIGNTILVSIPEEAFIVLFTVILLGVFDFLSYENVKENGDSLQKSDVIKASIPIVIPALISNILRYTGTNYLISFFALVVTLGIGILVIYGKWKKPINIGKTLLFMFIACAIVYTIEISYIPYVLRCTGKTMGGINDTIFYNFLFFLPERLVEGFIIVFLITKNTSLQVFKQYGQIPRKHQQRF